MVMVMVKKPSLSSLAQRSLRVRPDGPPPIRLSRTRLCQPSAPARRDAIAFMLFHLAHLHDLVHFQIFSFPALARFKQDDANTTRSVQSLGFVFHSDVTVRNRLVLGVRGLTWQRAKAAVMAPSHRAERVPGDFRGRTGAGARGLAVARGEEFRPT